MAAVTVATVGVPTTSNLNAYPTASFTPTAGNLLVAIGAINGDTSGISCASSANSMTWTSVLTGLTQGGGGEVAVFISNQFVPATPASMTVTFSTVGAGAGTGGTVAVAQVSGMLLTGRNSSVVRQTAKLEQQTSGTTLALTFGKALLTTNPTIGFVTNATNPATLTPPTSWTEQLDGGFATPTSGFEWISRDSGSTATTVTWGSNSGSAWSAFMVELDARPAVDFQEPDWRRPTSPMPVAVHNRSHWRERLTPRRPILVPTLNGWAEAA